ncbi:hypothetical protein M2139_001324 [Enterococcus sp. PF1-24]|uniref:hypothetical protein n=1 Tax=unclassified Enterococcus TaxID=2608891 RepID=UPI0024736A9D|nr:MULTISPECIES: hypothetical protein [unclassified Enterococcus]MDH6364371.1 hypothetical protein [Enterococcus sp. PFB1-1]MDH6401440.1 hypothetical protein [Enterococcus sp. PF1-24]
MKSKIVYGVGMLCASAALLGFSAEAEAADMYRLYNANSGEHFYTAKAPEANNLINIGWKYEGTGWVAPDSNTGEPVYRLYNKNGGEHHYTPDVKEKDALVSMGWKDEGIAWYAEAEGNPKADFPPGYVPAPKPIPKPPVSTVPPRKVDENITTVGGGEGSVPGSYRLLYSNKPYDAIPNFTQEPMFEFSADITMNGSRGANDFFGMQFVIAGDGPGSGQVGLDIGFQAGTSAEFAQNRIAVKTVNFPAGAGTNGEQFYSINTAAQMEQKAKVTVQYYKVAEGEYVITRLNDQVVGAYKTKLTTLAHGRYILHAQIEDWKGKNATLKLANVKVKKNGRDVTSQGAPNFHVQGNDSITGTSYDLTANTSNWLIVGAY